MLKLNFTLGRCDQFKLLVFSAHASDNIDLFQGQSHGILLLGPTHHIDRKHLTKEQKRHMTLESGSQMEVKGKV